MVSAVIAAGGKGKRMGSDVNKIFLPLNGKEIIAHTLSIFESCCAVNEIIIVAGDTDIDRIKTIIDRIGCKKVSAVTCGGKERQDSVYNGLLLAKGDFALIHDAARCLITEEQITAVINDAKKYGAAAVGVKVKDTLKSIDENGNIICTIDRERTVHIQTPQVFLRDEFLELHSQVKNESIAVTDDCAIFEYFGKTVHVTDGSYDNIKLTTPEDIFIGEQILKNR